ncbi:MAG: hypothetical protein B6I34_07525, partial [Anaerolineaceae bacterium 4572_32.1]
WDWLVGRGGGENQAGSRMREAGCSAAETNLDGRAAWGSLVAAEAGANQEGSALSEAGAGAAAAGSGARAGPTRLTSITIMIDNVRLLFFIPALLLVAKKLFIFVGHACSVTDQSRHVFNVTYIFVLVVCRHS